MKYRRTPEELQELSKKIVKYYFNNPGDNSYDSISVRFKCDPTTIRKAISIELDNRFKRKQQKCIKE